MPTQPPPPHIYKVLTTPPSRRSFPLPHSPLPYFTGDLFDRLVLFLHKHSIAFTSIECVARGVDKAAALSDGPTICVYVVQGAALTRKKEKGAGVEKEVAGEEGKLSGGEVSGEGEWHEERVVGGTSEEPLTEEEQIGQYVEEIARLFKKCQFAPEVPPEIKFIEFVGVIFHEDHGRTATPSGSWTNGGVWGT